MQSFPLEECGQSATLHRVIFNVTSEIICSAGGVPSGPSAHCKQKALHPVADRSPDGVTLTGYKTLTHDVLASTTHIDKLKLAELHLHNVQLDHSESHETCLFSSCC